MAPKTSIRTALKVAGIVVHRDPAVYVAVLPGPWLLGHSTPSWRIADPKKGFQRIVKEQRAKEIARMVLDMHRTFPNAITLATTASTFPIRDSLLQVPASAKFLVVDGQHRLFAQQYSKVAGQYPCIIHMDRTERQMAELFLEINDKQRRVPSSLRWDLVRLVKTDDQSTAMTVDIIYELATRNDSPFYSVGIDLTGEKNTMIKQGSLAPEIRSLVNRHLKKGNVEDFVGLFTRLFVAVRSLDPDGWGDTKSPDATFYKARVIRALIRLLSDMLSAEDMEDLTTRKLRSYLDRIDQTTLSEAELRRMQGSAGVQDLHESMKGQVFRSAKA